MPVQFTIATHQANSVKPSVAPLEGADQLLDHTWGRKTRTLKCAELLQSSFYKPSGTPPDSFSGIRAQHNGFVNSVTQAYNGHHHLILRPDDVWIAVLGQLNFYVNAHAEELRSQFVQHEGKKKLVVTAVGNRYSVDFGSLAQQMIDKIHDNVVDKSLRDWIHPDFTTTTHNDTVVSAVLMMSTLKVYFDYKMMLICGIPSVTLEGEKSDWEKLLARVDKLEEFGVETTAWAALLRPIFRRFVAAFDGEPDVDFWGRVSHYTPGGSGPTYLSGWITAFCVWDHEGNWQGPPLADHTARQNFEDRKNIYNGLSLDGTDYPIIDSHDVPTGFCEVDVKLNDNGEEFECIMVSGHVASLVEGEKRDTIRPVPAWFMFIKAECEDPMAQLATRMREEVERIQRLR
ncbi:hypothetical protein M413DRAFT_450071 [Hebeloma cylindrosporum]|uniref:DUF4419 domain-containing protein n=1 Tax=Hebeloma cylindrosporum TaxID=76867 RepID=A0A0C3BRS6_HEBCY|nr:hypothetical protein M413DRAFT_450071 [Hebeloma cylindrosporum h7]